jgi:hypothetical protein
MEGFMAAHNIYLARRIAAPLEKRTTLQAARSTN